MTAQLIDGKAIAANVRQRVAEKITARQQTGARAPGLAVVVVGEDPASHVYVSNKHRACEQAAFVLTTTACLFSSVNSTAKPC